MPVDTPPIQLAYLLTEELGNVRIGRPVLRHVQRIAIAFLEGLAQFRSFEPVLPVPIKVGKLLVRQLVELAIRRRHERQADEVIQCQAGQRERRTLARHEVGQRQYLAIAEVLAEQITVADEGIV